MSPFSLTRGHDPPVSFSAQVDRWRQHEQPAIATNVQAWANNMRPVDDSVFLSGVLVQEMIASAACLAAHRIGHRTDLILNEIQAFHPSLTVYIQHREARYRSSHHADIGVRPPLPPPTDRGLVRCSCSGMVGTRLDTGVLPCASAAGLDPAGAAAVYNPVQGQDMPSEIGICECPIKH